MDNSLSHPCSCILVYLIYSNRVLSWLKDYAKF